MKIMTVRVLSLAAFALIGSGAANAENIYDVDHARANARAGGPISEYDYELLERWGHLREARHSYYYAPRYYRKKRVGSVRWRERD